MSNQTFFLTSRTLKKSVTVILLLGGSTKTRSSAAMPRWANELLLDVGGPGRFCMINNGLDIISWFSTIAGVSQGVFLAS